MGKNWRANQTNDKFYPFCIVRPRKSHRARQNCQKTMAGHKKLSGLQEEIRASGSLLTKKVERTFGEAAF
jgi:hypothetical protein